VKYMGKNFRLLRKGAVEYLDMLFPVPGIARGLFTTRKGGVSEPPFHSLNLAFHVGDDPNRVLTNRRIFAEAAGISLDELTSAEQVHGDNVAVVSRSHRGRGAVDQGSVIPGADSLITNEKEVALITFYADCVPVYIVDSRAKAIGLAHAGWKGTALGISGKTVREMEKKFGADGRACFAHIGPSIGPCCYEVDRRVIDVFRETFGEKGDLFRKVSMDKWLLDLWSANKRDLIASGLNPQNISISGLCTCCNAGLFFSYRRDGGNTGRMAAFLKLI